MYLNEKNSYHWYLNGYSPAFTCAINRSKEINTPVPIVLPIRPWNTGSQKLQPVLIRKYNTTLAARTYQYNRLGHCTKRDPSCIMYKVGVHCF